MPRVLLAVFFLAAAPAAFGQAAPSCTLTATPPSVAGSGQVQLAWSTANAVACVASGAWSGPRDCAGGTATVTVDSTRTYNLTVRAATGKAFLSWTKPARNTDGTPATIVGYRLFQANPDGTDSVIVFSSGDTLSYAATLAPGGYSWRIRSVRDDGVESALSAASTWQVVATKGFCSVEVLVTSRPNTPALSVGSGGT